MSKSNMMTSSLFVLFRRYALLKRSLLLLSGIILIISTLSQVIAPIYIGKFIDSAYSINEDKNIMIYALIFFVLNFISYILTSVNVYITNLISWASTNKLRSDIMTSILSLTPDEIKEFATGEYIERVDGDASILSRFLSSFVSLFLTSLLLFIGTCIYLMTLSFILGSSVLVIGLVILLVLRKTQRITGPAWHEALEDASRYHGKVYSYIIGRETLYIYQIGKRVVKKLNELAGIWWPKYRRAYMSAYIADSLMTFLMSVMMSVCILISYLLHKSNSLTNGEIFTIFFFVFLIQRPLYDMHSELEMLQKAGGAARRVVDLLSKESLVSYGNEIISSQINSLKISELTYEYENVKALNNISLSCKSGDFILITGRSGSGKSTLGKLISRHLPNSSGIISIDDKNIIEYSRESIRKHILYVSSSITHSNATIRDYVTLLDANIDDKSILRSLKMICSDELWQRINHNLNLKIGQDIHMSDGEIQQLSLGRILLRNPSIIVFDEATRFLDLNAETQILNRLRAHLSHSIVIFISHRMAVLDYASHHYIMSEGNLRTGDSAGIEFNEYEHNRVKGAL